MANRLRISEALRKYNAQARKEGRPKLSMRKLVPLVFLHEEITEATGSNYLSEWNTSIDGHATRGKMVVPKARHLSALSGTLGITLDELMERDAKPA